MSATSAACGDWCMKSTSYVPSLHLWKTQVITVI